MTIALFVVSLRHQIYDYVQQRLAAIHTPSHLETCFLAIPLLKRSCISNIVVKLDQKTAQAVPQADLCRRSIN